ncbi:MAG: T9SS type A sorting domain-containing protein [Ignavibacteriaceae bacterium]|nr:T9SS type A sorting domain-containing protein [Ignavibacteriaceae bacterium]
MVNSSQGCDQFAGYLGGERYSKYVTNDQEAEIWGDWSPHSWDSNFWLTGTLIPASVDDAGILKEFSLLQNYPNPFNPKTSIQYVIGSSQFVTLKVYDVLGNEVATLVNEEKPAGSYQVEFSANSLSSGVYYYKLIAGSFSANKKMIILK